MKTKDSARTREIYTIYDNWDYTAEKDGYRITKNGFLHGFITHESASEEMVKFMVGALDNYDPNRKTVILRVSGDIVIRQQSKILGD